MQMCSWFKNRCKNSHPLANTRGLFEIFLRIYCCIDAEKRKVRYQSFFIYLQHKALEGEITDRKKKPIPFKESTSPPSKF